MFPLSGRHVNWSLPAGRGSVELDRMEKAKWRNNRLNVNEGTTLATDSGQ